MAAAAGHSHSLDGQTEQLQALDQKGVLPKPVFALAKLPGLDNARVFRRRNHRQSG
jgi:hypothetical protein